VRVTIDELTVADEPATWGALDRTVAALISPRSPRD